MKIKNFAHDLRQFSHCSRKRVNRALAAHFGTRFRFFRWVDDLQQQRRGVDLIAHFAGGYTLAIELKQLRREPTRVCSEAVPLETWSSIEGEKPGFLLKGGVKSDYVLWIFGDGSSLLVAFRSLAAAFRKHAERWKTQFHVSTSKTRGFNGRVFTSECVHVPFPELRRAIRRHVRGFGLDYEPSIAS